MVDYVEGPFDYYKDKHAGVTGAKIRADAEDPDLNAGTIQALSGELEGDAKKIPGQLSGEITDEVQKNPSEAAGKAKNLAANAFYASGLIKDFAKMVDTFDTTVSGLNQRYRTDLASAMRWAGQAAASTDDKGADDKLVTAKHMGPTVKANLQPEYNQAVNKLDNDADSVATRFNAPPAERAKYAKELTMSGLMSLDAAALWGVKLTDAEKKEYYKNALQGLTPEKQKEWIKNNIKNLDPAAAPFVDPSVQKYFADQVATDIRNPDDISSETVALLNFFKGEKKFSTDLYTDVTPDEMAKAVKHLNDKTFGNEPSDMKDMPDTTLYDGFLNAAGVSLATYTRGLEGGDAANAGRDWANSITDEDKPANAAALTLLMREGGEQGARFGTGFMNTVADEVYLYERENMGKQGDTPWDQRSYADGGGLIYDPDKVGIYEYSTYEGHETWGTAYGFNGSANDALANVLGAMGNSPEAAQDFFAQDDADRGPRLDYLMLERNWDGSDSRYTGLERSDNGDGFGEALEAATTGTSDDEGYDINEGAELASTAFTMVGENSGKDLGFLQGDWHLPPDVRDNLANIGAYYSSDTYDTLNTGKGVEGAGHLTVKYEHLNNVLGEIGRGDDNSGVEVLATALTIEGNDRIGQEIAEYEAEAIKEWRKTHPNHSGDIPSEVMDDIRNASALMSGSGGSELNTVAEDNGRVLGRLLGQSVSVDMDDEEAAKARAAIAGKAFDIAAGFIPGGSILGEGAEDLAKTGIDSIKSLGLDYLKDQVASAPESGSAKVLASSDNAWRDQLELGLANNLIRYGYGTGNDGVGIPPDALDANGNVKPEFVVDGGTMPEAWHDWWKSDGGSSLSGLGHSSEQSFNNAEAEAIEDAKK